MDKHERRVTKDVLERIDNPSEWDRGTKVLDVTIDYKKDARGGRGYYLCLAVYLETDRGFTQHCLSFGDEGDPSTKVLLQPTKAFSAKTLAGLVVDPTLLAQEIDAMKAEYVRRRDLKQARDEQARARYAAV